ncbi:MAG: DUF6456 domain-containing protein [Beijerinckiaceae bacterium]
MTAADQADDGVRLARQLERALRHLQLPGASLADDPLDQGRVVMILSRRKLSTVSGTLPREMVAEWLRRGLLEMGAGPGKRFILSEAGRMMARRVNAPEGESYLSQHREESEGTIAGEEGRPVRLNDAESPLAWLRRRRNRDGSPMLDDARFAAGERLRAEMTYAQMLPRVTANWTAAVASSARSGDRSDPTDATIAARQRVRKALDAVGPDLAGILIDVCGFLKGLADIERERQWPARAAKVVLDLALGRLASHYGLSSEAHGKPSLPMSSWQACDARPIVMPVYRSDVAS